MNRETPPEIARLAIMLIALGFALFLVATFTVFPMMENYKQCGTIFLCQNQ